MCHLISDVIQGCDCFVFDILDGMYWAIASLIVSLKNVQFYEGRN